MDTNTPHAPTLKYQLIEQKLGQSPTEFITARRHHADSEGNFTPMSYRLIAIELTRLTGIDVTLEAVRRWYGWHLANMERTAGTT